MSKIEPISPVAVLRGFVAGVEAAALQDLLTDAAVSLSLEHRRSGAQMVLTLGGATAELGPENGGLAIVLRAQGEQGLYLLQQFLLRALERRGATISPVWDRLWDERRPPNLIVAQVESIRQISPNFRRMRLHSADLARFGPDALHFRLLLPPRGRAPVWPRTGDDGRTLWPEGADALHRPVYTFRALDARAGWADVDIFLHEGGRVTDWTAQAARGDAVGLMGPAGRALGNPEWIALFGDETALPAIARHLAALPRNTRGAACILCDPADQQALDHPPGMRLHWLDRGAGDTLCAALSDLELPEGTGSDAQPARAGQASRLVWFAAEKGQADRARTLLHDLRGLSRHEAQVTAYWHLARDESPPG